tara:strand:- start:141 stop:377 length:237 start_codon:yes stop_codon:yes gene_type:complete
VSLQYSLLFSNNNIITFFNLQNTNYKFANDMNMIKSKNNKLTIEIEHIQKNNEILEMYARENYGYIKKNETFFQVIKK